MNLDTLPEILPGLRQEARRAGFEDNMVRIQCFTDRGKGAKTTACFRCKETQLHLPRGKPPPLANRPGSVPGGYSSSSVSPSNRSLETVSLAPRFLPRIVSLSPPSFLVQSEVPSHSRPLGTAVQEQAGDSSPPSRRGPGRPADGAVPRVLGPRVPGPAGAGPRAAQSFSCLSRTQTNVCGLQWRLPLGCATLPGRVFRL